MVDNGDLNNVPKESIFGELDKLFMKANSFDAAAEYMEETGLLSFFPELKALQDTPQSERWHPEGWSFNFFEESPIPLNTSLAQPIRADGSFLLVALNDLDETVDHKQDEQLMNTASKISGRHTFLMMVGVLVLNINLKFFKLVAS